MEGKDLDFLEDEDDLDIKLRSSHNIKIKKRIKEEKFTKFLLSGTVVVCMLLISCLVIYFLMPKITLKGKKEMVISCDDKYKEQGYKASYFSKNLTKKVKVKGKVNPQKLGKYKLTYYVSNGIFTKKVIRTVIVTDTTKPVIELTGGKLTYVCPNDEYVEPGYKANDNYDGDLTKKVLVKNQSNKIVYEVRDKSKNYTKVVRKIEYKDVEGPTIKLIGGDIMSVFVGESYTDPGYEVNDNCDKSIKDKVEVTGTVNTAVAGTYTITYKVADKAGNSTEVKRTVIVAKHGQKGTIYLTFDDGPQNGTTNVILDILKQNNVKATFFVTSKGPDDLIKREFDEGHTVALHTGSHNYSYLYSSKEAYFEDLQAVKSRVDRITGQDSKIIRFPGGSSNTVSRKYTPGLMSYLTDEVLKRGFRYYDWNIESGDAGSLRDSTAIYKNVIGKLRKDRVNMILMHDIKSYTRDALDRIIKYGKENGYVFDKITNETEMVRQRVNN